MHFSARITGMGISQEREEEPIIDHMLNVESLQSQQHKKTDGLADRSPLKVESKYIARTQYCLGAFLLFSWSSSNPVSRQRLSLVSLLCRLLQSPLVPIPDCLDAHCTEKV